MRISDWSSDVCSSDLNAVGKGLAAAADRAAVGDAAAADQPHAVVRFAGDRAAILHRRAGGAEDQFADFLIELIGGGDACSRTADRAAVDDARIGGSDLDARLRRSLTPIIPDPSPNRP